MNIGIFLGPKEREREKFFFLSFLLFLRLLPAGNPAAGKGASFWSASLRCGTFSAASSAARLGSGPVFYTTIGN